MISQWKKNQSIADINKVEISNDFNFLLLTENQNVLEKLQEKTLRGDHVFRNNQIKVFVSEKKYYFNKADQDDFQFCFFYVFSIVTK